MAKPDDGRSADTNASDDRCEHKVSVERRLEASGYLALRRIDCDCECDGGVLSLRGCVPSHYLKQVAQRIAATVDGIHRVDNRIEVVGNESRTT
jgi:osmotically-inducible protein OsmY